MSLTWKCQDDTPFILEAIREAATAAGMDEDKAKYCDFPRHTQSFILQRAQQFKAEYHRETEVLR